jgi:hypothetical protein
LRLIDQIKVDTLVKTAARASKAGGSSNNIGDSMSRYVLFLFQIGKYFCNRADALCLARAQRTPGPIGFNISKFTPKWPPVKPMFTNRA